MIRILHIVNSMDRGGVETTLMNIFRNLDRSRIVFDFLLQTDRECDYNEEIRKLGGIIYHVTPRKKSIIKNISELNNFFKKHNEYKIVHMHVSSLTYITPLVIAKKHNVPVRIIHSRNTKEGGNSKIHLLLHYMNKLRIGNIATHYFACSELAGEWLFNKKILNNKNYRIINNGIQTSKFNFSEQIRKKTRQELKCQDKIAIVNVGRLHRQKNQLFLLHIFEKFINKHDNSILYIIGDGKLKSELQNEIKQLKLTNQIILLGKKENINEILQGMDVFVMTSFYEGLPGSVIEAQGAGLPCLISDTITRQVAITDLVHFESLEHSYDEWADEIYSIYKSTPRKRMGDIIRKSGFDMKLIAKELEQFYEEAL